jgi:hypothetical protein
MRAEKIPLCDVENKVSNNQSSYWPIIKVSGLKVRPRCRLGQSNNVYYGNRGRQTTGQGRQVSIIQSSGAKVQDGRQAQGQGQARVNTRRARKIESGEKQ